MLARFHEVRNFSAKLAENLAPEDCVVQSIPDVSPTKWHLSHTTWFFETFILKKWKTGYRDAVPEYAYLFTSYYNAAGTMHRRDLRGLISRPTAQMKPANSRATAVMATVLSLPLRISAR